MSNIQFAKNQFILANNSRNLRTTRKFRFDTIMFFDSHVKLKFFDFAKAD